MSDDIVRRLRLYNVLGPLSSLNIHPETPGFSTGRVLGDTHQAADEIERLRAELDAANKDVARYRWLRGHCESVVGLRLDWFIPQAEDLQWGDGSDTFDAAIDAAIAGEPT